MRSSSVDPSIRRFLCFFVFSYGWSSSQLKLHSESGVTHTPCTPTRAPPSSAMPYTTHAHTRHTFPICWLTTPSSSSGPIQTPHTKTKHPKHIPTTLEPAVVLRVARLLRPVQPQRGQHLVLLGDLLLRGLLLCTRLWTQAGGGWVCGSASVCGAHNPRHPYTNRSKRTGVCGALQGPSATTETPLACAWHVLL